MDWVILSAILVSTVTIDEINNLMVLAEKLSVFNYYKSKSDQLIR